MKNSTIFWVVVGVLLLNRKKKAAIRAIYPEVPEFYECEDGTFSTSGGQRGCARHGGKKTGIPIKSGGSGSDLIIIQDVPLDQIKEDTTLFQGREKKFSERSVQNIVEDATTGKFQWANLDPITLWKSPKGIMYILSGHSRKEGFRRLAAAGVKVDGKGFTKIPAKIVSVPLEVARKMALESNTLSTKETDIERAAYYRRLRQEGTPERILLEGMKKTEGRNWTNVYAYTFLNPDGKTWAMLRQFAESEDTSAMLAKSLAKWIGQARRTFTQLTNLHEYELHDWLFNLRGYGTGSNQVSKEIDFLEKVKYFVQKNTFFGEFNSTLPLNIFNTLVKSPAEQEYDRQIQELQLQVTQQDTLIKKRIKELSAQGATKSDLSRIITPLETQLRNARAELARLMQKKSEVVEYSKNEPRLFGRRRK